MALRPKLNFTILDPGSGKARPGAWVTFYGANTLVKTTLYADDDVSTLANPVQANGLGQVAVRVDPGIYDVSMSWDGAQPTVVEDVLAWTPEAAVISDPGDLMVGSPGSGSPVRLPVGQENQILVVDQGIPTWKHLGSNDGVPTASPGALLHVLGNGYVAPLAPGTHEQALVMMGGMPTWASLLPAGTVMPINQPGDLVVGAPGTGLTARLAAGAVGQILTSGEAGAGLYWDFPGKAGIGEGQCYLRLEQSVSPPVLQLIPLNGNQLWIGDRSRTIPDGGVLLASTGLASYTNYYIYAAWVSGAMVLEASTVEPTTAWSYYFKTGDNSRALVGYAHAGPSGGADPIWMDNPTVRGVLSFFHQDERTGGAQFTAPRSTSSTTAVELHPEIQCYFIAWGFTQVALACTGVAETNTDNAGFFSVLTLDGVHVAGTFTTASKANYSHNIATSITKTLSAVNQLHQVSLYGSAQAGTTATWHGESGVLACRTQFTISL
jgi:hypothetical protein